MGGYRGMSGYWNEYGNNFNIVHKTCSFWFEVQFLLNIMMINMLAV